jgi:hypothetical protein
VDSDRPLPTYANRTCGQCHHWFRVPTGLELQKVPQGQCRRGPPAAQMVNGGQQTASFYPPVPGNFSACGEFESLLSLEVDEDSKLVG